MKLLPIISMAAIVASATKLGVARGFNFAKQLAQSRTFTRRNNTGVTTPFNRRAMSTCFVAPEGSTATTDTSSTTSSDKESSNTANEIEDTAQLAVSITGSLPPPLNFGGISFLDTSSLTKNHAHRVIFILGGPGAGKGTQSEKIVDTYKCVHLSVGDLLRTGAEKKDYPHADMVKECLVQGNIVPVELSLGLLRIAMDEKANEKDSQYGSRLFCKYQYNAYRICTYHKLTSNSFVVCIIDI